MNIVWWVGAIISVAVAVLVLAAACLGAVRLVAYELDKLREQGRDAWLDWQKQKLRTASWWFSEDEPTRMLLADLAELSEWEARDKWRKRRTASISSAKLAASAPAEATYHDGLPKWLTTDNQRVIDCMGSAPECAANGCQWDKTAGYRAGEHATFSPADKPFVTGESSEWWICFPCWNAYYVPTTGYFGKCPDCGRETKRWPADPNETLRMTEWRRPLAASASPSGSQIPERKP